jgi:hypothetical protein
MTFPFTRYLPDHAPEFLQSAHVLVIVSRGEEELIGLYLFV